LTDLFKKKQDASIFSDSIEANISSINNTKQEVLDDSPTTKMLLNPASEIIKNIQIFGDSAHKV
jgi:hypothetical protein